MSSGWVYLTEETSCGGGQGRGEYSMGLKEGFGFVLEIDKDIVWFWPHHGCGF